ncbi:dehydrogenase/reductase SDR family member 12 [Pseudoscourfieldia marina]
MAVSLLPHGPLALLRQTSFVLNGLVNFTQAGFHRNSKHFPSLSSGLTNLAGVLCVVTGANAGLGYAAALALANRGASVVCVCRNASRGEAAVSAIKAETGNENVTLQHCDISSLEDSRNLANFLRGKPVHCLINNAGVLLSERQTTVFNKKEVESSFAINTLGTFAVTETLMPNLMLAADAPHAQLGKPRVVTVTSGGMYTAPLESCDFDPPIAQAGRNFDGVKLYAMHKRQQVALTEHWHRSYPSITFVSMHPGWAETPGVQNALPSFSAQMQGKLRTPEQGADTVVWLASLPSDAPELQGGALYFDRQQVRKQLWFGFGTHHSEEAIKELGENLHKYI